MLLTNKQIKLVNSLHSKKGRNENELFLVEGEKGILEVLESDFNIQFIIMNQEMKSEKITAASCEVYWVEGEQLNRLSSLTANNFGIAIVQSKTFDMNEIDFNSNYTLVLDGIRDPGNLGTIIRICDWYGIRQIVLSFDSIELYNPKVISATMGSFKRVKYIYQDLKKFFELFPQVPVYGALLKGESVYQVNFKKNGFILIGNESAGIRDEIKSFIDFPITIPKIGEAESLNAAISSGIILDNVVRNHFSSAK